MAKASIKTTTGIDAFDAAVAQIVEAAREAQKPTFVPTERELESGGRVTTDHSGLTVVTAGEASDALKKASSGTQRYDIPMEQHTLQSGRPPSGRPASYVPEPDIRMSNTFGSKG